MYVKVKVMNILQIFIIITKYKKITNASTAKCPLSIVFQNVSQSGLLNYATRTANLQQLWSLLVSSSKSHFTQTAVKNQVTMWW